MQEKDNDKLLRQIATDTAILKVKLYGEGDEFEGDISEIKKAVCYLRKDHDKLARVVWITIGTLVGSGSLAGGLIGWLG